MKVLIVRFSSIGDIVLTTPVIRCLKKQIENIEIHFLTKNYFYSVIENNPYIDKIYTINSEIKTIIPQLKEEEYDYIIDLHNNLRTNIVKNKLKTKSYSVNKLNFKKWLLVNLKINIMPKIHIVDRYMQTVAKLGVVNDGEGLDYFILEDKKIDLSVLPVTHQKGFIGFVIGGKHATKVLPEEKVISICNKINKPIILLGGKEDNAMGKNIVKACGDNVYNSCGEFSLGQSAYLISIADKIITNDTGLMHIASAFRKPIVSVWGNTVPDFGMYPYLPEKDKQLSLIVQNNTLKCRPCSKIGYAKCPKKHFNCMKTIDEKAIIEFINK